MKNTNRIPLWILNPHKVRYSPQSGNEVPGNPFWFRVHRVVSAGSLFCFWDDLVTRSYSPTVQLVIIMTASMMIFPLIIWTDESNFKIWSLPPFSPSYLDIIIKYQVPVVTRLPWQHRLSHRTWHCVLIPPRLGSLSITQSWLTPWRLSSRQ